MFSHPFPLLSPRDIARPGWHTAPPAVAPWNSSEPDPSEHPSAGGDPTVRHPWSEETPASWVAVAGKAIIRVPTIPVCVSLWIHTWTSRCDMWRQSHILPPTSPRSEIFYECKWHLESCHWGTFSPMSRWNSNKHTIFSYLFSVSLR